MADDLDALFGALDGEGDQDGDSSSVSESEPEPEPKRPRKEPETRPRVVTTVDATASEPLNNTHTSTLQTNDVSTNGAATVPAASATSPKEEEEANRQIATGTLDKSVRSYSSYPPNYTAPPRRPVTEPAKKYAFELDPFQKQAIEYVENGESVLVAAHTSAGKTAVAEYAVAKSFKQGQRVVYTSPIKALSNQKFRDLQEEFGHDNVGLMTGDNTINPDATALVMTTEILRSMLYRGSEIMREVAWVIYDEVHYMRDSERGVVWEESIILLPHQVRFVFLSATIPNANQFADWIVKVHQQVCHVVYTNFVSYFTFCTRIYACHSHFFLTLNEFLSYYVSVRYHYSTMFSHMEDKDFIWLSTKRELFERRTSRKPWPRCSQEMLTSPLEKPCSIQEMARNADPRIIASKRADKRLVCKALSSLSWRETCIPSSSFPFRKRTVKSSPLR